MANPGILKNGYFVSKIFRKLLAFNILAFVSFFVEEVVDAFVGGYELGEQALYAISVINPLLFITHCVGVLAIPGLATKVGQYIYIPDREGIRKTAGESLIVAVITSFALALFLLLIKDSYLAFYECTGNVAEYASTYYDWMILFVFLCPFKSLTYYLVSIDGDASLVMIGAVLSTAIRTVLSFVLCRNFGIMGIGLTACITEALRILISSIHFFKKTNTIRFKLYFSFKDIKQACVLSAGTFLSTALFGISGFILNGLILRKCGAEYVPVFALFNFAVGAFFILESISGSVEALLAGFYAEENNNGLTNVFRTALKSLLILGALITIVLFILAKWLPGLYGLDARDIVGISTLSVKIFCFMAIPWGLINILLSIYKCTNRPKLGALLSATQYFVFMIVPPVILVQFWGFTGILIGVAIGPVLALALFMLISKCMYKQLKFPLYLEKYENEVESFDIIISPASIVEIRNRAEESLKAHGYTDWKIILMIEEMFTRISEKNSGKKITAELTLIYEDNRVIVYIRDNGVVFNFTCADNPVESISSHVLNTLILSMKDANYAITTSFNRNGFVFTKKNQG